MIVCGACKQDADPGKFCNKCGAPLAASAYPQTNSTQQQQQQQQQQQAAATTAPGCATSSYTADVGTEGACHKCKQPFPPGTKEGFYLEAFGKKFHKECFTCVGGCNKRIFSFTKFFAGPGDLPVCNACYSSQAPNCFACGKQAPSHVVAHGKKWHAACMVCAGCGSGDQSKGEMFEDAGKLYHLDCF